MRETKAEKLLHNWLEDEGYTPHKGVDVDCEAWKGLSLSWLIEVKGDQANDQAKRLSFLVGLGQLFIARSHWPKVKASLALTKKYEYLVEKYADVLSREKISILYIRDDREDPVKKVDLSKINHSFIKTHKGHPPGRYHCGRVRYTVEDGKITKCSFSDDKKKSMTSFANVCRELGIHVKSDSAARVLARRSTKRKTSA